MLAGNRELKEIPWKCVSNRLLLHKWNQNENYHCQRNINIKIPLLTSKLNFELRKKMAFYVWSIDLYSSDAWTLGKLGRKYLESFEVGHWSRMEKRKWSEKIANEEVIERIGEKRTLLNIILRKSRKANWIGHILIINCLLLDAIEDRWRKWKALASRDLCYQ